MAEDVSVLYPEHHRTGIPYEYRWGSAKPWKQVTLQPGRSENHWFPLGEDRNRRVPTPYVRFDCIRGDGRFTPKEYKMQFYATGYAGYGSARNNTRPKQYYFRYGADGKTLDIFAR